MEIETTLEEISLVSEITLTYRPRVMPSKRPKISSSRDAFKILLSTWDTGKILFVEEFKAVLLNKANRVIGIVPISFGSIDGTIADVRVIFGAALKACAVQIMVAHNHPSGNMQPSQADINLTRKLKEAGKLLDIPLIDHLIITADTYYSFTDEGIL